MEEELTENKNERYVLVEFKALRDEFYHLLELASSALHISVLAALGIIGYLLQSKSLNLVLFPLPFFIIIPSLFIILSRFQAMMKIFSYIRIFLEKEGGLRYETRYSKFNLIERTLGKKRGFSYVESVFYLFLGLGLLSIGIFISKGVLPDFNSWASIILYIIIYFSPFPFYFYAFWLINQNWRKIYDECWKKIKSEEV